MTLRGAAFFAAGAALALWAGWGAFPKWLYPAAPQPLVFSHKAHTAAGSACADCHALSAQGRFAGIPAVAKCGECHSAPMGTSENEKKMLEAFIGPSREIPWKVYARQPDNVWFSHAIHVNRGKVKCEDCHGDHGATETLREYRENRLTGYSRDIWGPRISRVSLEPGARLGMKMDDCEGCHAKHKVEASCLGCHR